MLYHDIFMFYRTVLDEIWALFVYIRIANIRIHSMDFDIVLILNKMHTSWNTFYSPYKTFIHSTRKLDLLKYETRVKHIRCI